MVISVILLPLMAILCKQAAYGDAVENFQFHNLATAQRLCRATLRPEMAQGIDLGEGRRSLRAQLSRSASSCRICLFMREGGRE
jgi:hypothetical protein